MDDSTLCILGLWIFWGLWAMKVYSDKEGSALMGFIIGFLLGPLGVMIAYASSGGLVPCRFCRSKISKQARVCPKCGRDVWN
jgi:hypothetical protein